MTREEALSIADEFFGAFLDLDLRGVRLARPAQVTARIDDDDDLIGLGPVTFKRGIVRREIHLELVFQEGSFTASSDTGLVTDEMVECGMRAFAAEQPPTSERYRTRAKFRAGLEAALRQWRES